MEKRLKRKLVLEDGNSYHGYAFGSLKDVVVELVFNTSMVGYQEIVSDPSYACQAVVMTYPVIGNYGMTDDDYESKSPTIGGLIVRDYNDNPSNFRYTKTLSEVLDENNIPGIYGVDTRKLTRDIRNYGTRRCCICSEDITDEEAIKKIKETAMPHNQVSLVSCKKKWYYRSSNHKFNVVAIDCGIKMNILRAFKYHNCNVTVVPWNTDFKTIEAMDPDGVFISNGPGDPADATPVIDLVKKIKGIYPLFGICLGHQIICLAYGAKTYKLKFGHRGGNHPVKDLYTNKITVTSQNHSYAVDKESLDDTNLKLKYVNLLDNTVEGTFCEEDKVLTIQYHPESAPGPQDSDYLFEDFLKFMQEKKENAEEK